MFRRKNYEFEEWDESRYGSNKLRNAALVMSLLVICALGWIGWMAYEETARPLSLEEIPMAQADTDPFRIKPEDPGGIDIPHRDKSIFENLKPADQRELPRVEQLLPEPEAPVEIVEAQPSAPEVAEKPKSVAQEVAGGSMEAGAPISNVATAKPETLAAIEPSAQNTQLQAPVPTMVAPKAEPMREVVKAEKPVIRDVPQTMTSNRTAQVANIDQYRIQLGAYRNRGEANSSWSSIQKRFSAPLAGKQSFIEEADLGTKGVFYRLQAAPYGNHADAKKACDALSEQNQACFVVKR